MAKTLRLKTAINGRDLDQNVLLNTSTPRLSYAKSYRHILICWKAEDERCRVYGITRFEQDLQDLYLAQFPAASPFLPSSSSSYRKEKMVVRSEFHILESRSILVGVLLDSFCENLVRPLKSIILSKCNARRISFSGLENYGLFFFAYLSFVCYLDDHFEINFTLLSSYVYRDWHAVECCVCTVWADCEMSSSNF